jgi:hypothetical protein
LHSQLCIDFYDPAGWRDFFIGGLPVNPCIRNISGLGNRCKRGEPVQTTALLIEL